MDFDTSQLPEDPLVNDTEAMKIFDITKGNFNTMKYAGNKTAGKFTPKIKGMVNLVELADYLLKRNGKGNGKAHVRPTARAIKDFYTKTDKVTIDQKEITEEVGIEHALNRIRQLEVILAKKVREAIDDPASTADALRSWNQTLEILRKTEVDSLKVLEEQKQLVRMDEVKELYNKGIVPVKTRLMALPSQLSRSLENQDSTTIQKILTNSIAKALDDISKIWDDEE